MKYSLRRGRSSGPRLYFTVYLNSRHNTDILLVTIWIYSTICLTVAFVVFAVLEVLMYMWEEPKKLCFPFLAGGSLEVSWTWHIYMIVLQTDWMFALENCLNGCMVTVGPNAWPHQPCRDLPATLVNMLKCARRADAVLCWVRHWGVTLSTDETQVTRLSTGCWKPPKVQWYKDDYNRFGPHSSVTLKIFFLCKTHL